jgi:hypothetical protein
MGMTANTIDLNWEAMVAIVVVVVALVLMAIVALSRYSVHHFLRVGFFVERGHHEDIEPANEEPPPS